MSAFASFIAGTLGLVGLTLLAPPLTVFALKFGPPEYFSLMSMGMVVLSFLTGASMIHSLMMACFGIILGTVGTDTVSGSTRFTFGLTELMDGIGLVPLVMGLFGISEIILNLEQHVDRDVFKTKVKGLLPTVEDWIKAKWAILRGTVIGFILGILPGGGAVLSSFVAYAVEKRFSKYPEKFGTGMIEGVAAPEAAMIRGRFGPFAERIAAGLAGPGSECFGFDDAVSRDHDWGPGFCLWLTDEDDARIGRDLQSAYAQLPAAFMGFVPRRASPGEEWRVGVSRTSAFFRRFTGLTRPPATLSEWLRIPEHALAT